MIPKDLEEIEKESCGMCPLFIDEDVYGDGWCEFHQSETNCSSWCEDGLFKIDKTESL